MTRFRIWVVLGSACVLFTLTVVATGMAGTGKPKPSSYNSDPRSGAALNRDAALNPAPSPQRLYPEDPRQRINNARAVNNPSADATAQDTQSETSVAVLGSKVVVAFNDSGSYGSGGNQFTGYASSADGGTSFVDHGALPSSLFGDIGDPVLAKDSSTGAIYLATPAFKPDDTVQVFKSTDGGQSFGSPVNGTPGSRSVDSQDKEWMAVDNFAGAGRHNVYLCYTDFPSDAGAEIRFNRSTDQGATFGPTGVISHGGQGCLVAVGPDHSVDVLYYRGTGNSPGGYPDGTGGDNKLFIRSSTDRGVSFGPEHQVADLTTTTVNGGLALKGGLRSNSFPHAAVNPVSGAIVAVWNDDPTASTTDGDNGDVFYSRSKDGGANWSAPVRVNEVAARDQFFPTVSITPDGKSIMFGYYDRSQDAQNLAFHRQGRAGTMNTTTGAITMRRSFQLGPNTPLAIGQDPVINATYMGDYDQIDATNGSFNSTWADNRDGDGFHAHQPDIRFAQIGTTAGDSDLGVAVNPVPASIALGNTTDVRVTLTATGGSARDVFVNLSPASGLSFLSASGPSGSDCDVINQFVGCSVGNIAAGGSRTIHVTARGISAAGSRTVKASATTTSNETNQANNAGTATVSVSGTVATTQYSTGDIAVAIPDPGSVDVPLSVPDVGPVLKAQALVRLNHTWDDDLAIYLIDPSNHVVALSIHHGGAGDDYGSGTSLNCAGTPTTFNDSAAMAISAGTPPFAGAFKPDDPLSNLAYVPSAGTWNLLVSDDAADEVGTIGCFKLKLTHG